MIFFSEEEERLLSAVGAQLGTMIQRRLSEEETKRLAEDLADSNEKLQQFAYAASHDLQEPLRMITNFLEMLKQEYEGKLSPDADKWIHFAVGGGNRMRSLIQDLLRYSRVGRKDLNWQLIDSRRIVECVVESLKPSIQESGARVEVGDLPEARGDLVLLGQVFQNLFQNALKFCSSEPPRVRVSGGFREEMSWFQVEDNGIGIAPEHREPLGALPGSDNCDHDVFEMASILPMSSSREAILSGAGNDGYCFRQPNPRFPVGSERKSDFLFSSFVLLEGFQVGQVLRTPGGFLARDQISFREIVHFDLSERSARLSFPGLRKGHAVDRGEQVNPDRRKPQLNDQVGLREFRGG